MEEEEVIQEIPMNSGRDRNRGTRSNRVLTEKEMVTMLQQKTSSEILLRISRTDEDLERLLQDRPMTPRKIVLIIQVLRKALDSKITSQPEAVNNVVKTFIFTPSFHALLGDCVKRNLVRDSEFLKSVLFIIEVALERLPNTAVQQLAYVQICLEKTITEEYSHDQDLKEKLRCIKDVMFLPTRIAVQAEEAERRMEILQNEAQFDPTLFRGLSIVPLQADFDPQHDIIVRANKIQGKYNTVNDYLDIQFRLLRADLIMPLRTNILNFQSNEDHQNIRGIQVYTQVRIVRPVCHDKGLCFRLSFDVSRLRRVNWQVSKRLKYGSLLCMSSDNFNSYYCAVVEHSDSTQLSKGLVDVQFILAAEDAQAGEPEEFMKLLHLNRDLRFIMVESPTYFEAYKYVLQGLQNITEMNFPFWQYIGHCLPNIGPPQYLQTDEDEEDKRYDLRPLVDTNFIIKDVEEDDYEFSQESLAAAAVTIRNLESWPNANTFNLDQSQFVALQSALTKEFSIIQGPPGTGKTFIGQMIMKALLHNKQAWNANGGEEQSPILLVCYTNHALDQFLEGVLDFFKGKLVRVGSRSKSERLEEYNLRGMRSRARENRTLPMEIHLGKREIRIKMKELKAALHVKAAKLEMLEREIVVENFLEEFIQDTHFRSLTGGLGNTSVVLKWLGIGCDVEDLIKRAEKKKRRHEEHMQKQQQQHGIHVQQQQQHGIHIQQHPELQQQMEAQQMEGAAGNTLDEDDEESDVDDDILDLVNADNNRVHQLDVDDEEDEDELFQELFGDSGEERMDEMRQVNRRLDDVDLEAVILRKQNIAFNISDYGEEDGSLDMSVEEKKHWKELLPLKKKYRTILLQHLQSTDRMSQEEVERIQNVWKLPRKEKWRLYRYWTDLYCRQLRGEIRDTSQHYQQAAKRYQEILHQEDKAILEKATIIGMTTTGAARYQNVLREIGPKIVIVEEAAEVLESHVVTSVSEHCQHVILIGDHKQLRPSPSVYELKKNYGLDISLFERLLNNGVKYDQLKYQHRMRPEISYLLKIPDLYPDLKDHEAVKSYPSVTRVKGDVYFINHSMHDRKEEETSTFSNPYEAKFLIGLCEYLLQQGYRASQITILSPYAGQIHVLKSNLQNLTSSKAAAFKLKGLKVSSVDNYQGEENDIILLSLVRSNEDNQIGFLKANNRICVALSRAKIGLYVIGNLDGLCAESPLLHEIVGRAAQLGFVSEDLHLFCSHHPKEITRIKTPEDFHRVPEGGCSRPCTFRLSCGHQCKRICHTDDMKHEKSNCKEPCRVKCEKCQQNCHGKHYCGKHDFCRMLIQKRIPICGHMQQVECYMNPNEFECKEKCLKILPCGHACQENCGSRHQHSSTSCNVLVQVQSQNCRHKPFEVACHKASSQDVLECPEPCGTVLECEHMCKGTCGRCLQGRLHVDCKEQCKKILICGHPCKATCSNCPPCSQQCETACVHSQCKKLCGDTCPSCVEPCNWNCPHNECEELCCQPCERPPCDLPCPKVRSCGHGCSGLCGEICPRLCTICDKKELMETSLYGYDGDPITLFVELDCGHCLEVEFVDQWMATSNAVDEESDQEAIGLKTCPSCKTPIRKCKRYNKQIKKMLINVERVKRKYIGEPSRITEKKHQLDRLIGDFRGNDRILLDRFVEDENTVPSEARQVAQYNQVLIFRRIGILTRMANECQTRYPETAEAFQNILQDLKLFGKWTLTKREIFSQQNITDAEKENSRLSSLFGLLKLENEIRQRGLRNTIPVQRLTLMGHYVKELSKRSVVCEKTLNDSKELWEELRTLVPESVMALTAAEKLEIVKAMSLTRGAWYRCPNGHIYAIGECGQAMERAFCPECKEAIGGTNHELLRSNAWAPEMDNAEVPISQNLDADREYAERLQRELNLL